jgi:hypothetical protein
MLPWIISPWELTSLEVVLVVSVCSDFDIEYLLALVIRQINMRLLLSTGIGVPGFALGGGKLELNQDVRLKFSDSGLCRTLVAQ